MRNIEQNVYKQGKTFHPSNSVLNMSKQTKVTDKWVVHIFRTATQYNAIDASYDRTKHKQELTRAARTRISSKSAVVNL